MRPVIVHVPWGGRLERVTVIPSSWGALAFDAPDPPIPGTPICDALSMGARSWVREVGAPFASQRFVIESVDQLDAAMGAVPVGQPHAEPADADLLRRSAHRPLHR